MRREYVILHTCIHTFVLINILFFFGIKINIPSPLFHIPYSLITPVYFNSPTRSMIEWLICIIIIILVFGLGCTSPLLLLFLLFFQVFVSVLPLFFDTGICFRGGEEGEIYDIRHIRYCDNLTMTIQNNACLS